MVNVLLAPGVSVTYVIVLAVIAPLAAKPLDWLLTALVSAAASVVVPLTAKLAQTPLVAVAPLGVSVAVTTTSTRVVVDDESVSDGLVAQLLVP